MVDGTKITIGEARALSVGDQPVEPSDGAAIEARASADANANALAERDEDKTALRDALAARTSRLTSSSCSVTRSLAPPVH